MRNVLLVRYGEVFLKGDNRPFFLRRLIEEIKNAVRPINGHVWMSDGRIYVSDFSDIEECIKRVKCVFGIHSVSPAVEMEKDDFDAVCKIAAEMMEKYSGSFKVVAKRSDKHYLFDSPQIAKMAGAYILSRNPALSVDVHNPEHEITIEIRDNAYLSIEKIQGAGGMPMGTNGKAMLLLSGGIDSPVAGYMIAKRGVELACVYFHSFPYTSERAKDKVLQLAEILSRYCGKIHFYTVPFTEIQMKIHEKCPDNYTTLIMRRFMMRIAQLLAVKESASALVTGESIGQVASQTMDALACTDCMAELPVFRPLIGMDKSEIIDRAEQIGTFNVSSLPYEDCCTIFTPRHPTTHPKKEAMEKAEKNLNVQEMIDKAVAESELILINSH